MALCFGSVLTGEEAWKWFSETSIECCRKAYDLDLAKKVFTQVTRIWACPASGLQYHLHHSAALSAFTHIPYNTLPISERITVKDTKSRWHLLRNSLGRLTPSMYRQKQFIRMSFRSDFCPFDTVC